jgi:acyl-CoA thioesterase
MAEEAPASSDQAYAEAVGAAMYARDRAVQALGIALLEIAPGRSLLRMPVSEAMTNSGGLCHGGVIFTLADAAFGYACNSRNDRTLALGCTIDYVSAARPGEVLIARGEERVLNGRTGVYDITVSAEDGRLVALFHGKSYRVKGESAPGVAETFDRAEGRADKGGGW